LDDLEWPWTAKTHSDAEKMRLLEPTAQIWMKIDPNKGGLMTDATGTPEKIRDWSVGVMSATNFYIFEMVQDRTMVNMAD